jgi:hypothetical protein
MKQIDSGSNDADYIGYSSGSFTMLGIRRERGEVIGRTWNATLDVRNFRYQDTNINSTYQTNTVFPSGSNLALRTGSYVLDESLVISPLEIDWSEEGPKLWIGENPSDPVISTDIDFAAAFIYNRVLSDSEINNIYNYVNEFVPLT